MKKILLYCICTLWVVIIMTNVFRLFGSEYFVALLSEVPEVSPATQVLIKAAMFYIELVLGLLFITRGNSKWVYAIAFGTMILAGYTSSIIENSYLCTIAYLIAIVLFTKDSKYALQEFIVYCLALNAYAVLMQTGRFSLDSANYKNYAVQVLSFIDYKALPLLAYLYSKYYGKERILCFSSVGTLLAALSSSVTKILRKTTSSTADSLK